MEPPRTEAALIARAEALSGLTVGELGRSLDVAIPADQRRAKGLVGRLVQDALGATAGSAPVPDFVALGVELKTIPLRPDGAPRESTFVCRIPLHRVPDTEWEDSPVCHKLARVLWVPVESAPGLPLPDRRIGRPMLWSPDLVEDRWLREDWTDLAERIALGEADELTGHAGRALQVRPKAADSRARCAAPRDGGGFVTTVPRGFYLRARFTRGVIERLQSSPDATTTI